MQFYKANIAEKLYIRKRTKTEMKLRTRKPGVKGAVAKSFKEKKTDTESKPNVNTTLNESPLDSQQQARMLKVMFKKIRYDTLPLLMDPLISVFLFPWRNTNCLKPFIRQHVLEEASFRFNQEMDIVRIMRKVRDSNDILKYMVGTDDRALLKINKERVINIELEEPIKRPTPGFEIEDPSDMTISDISNQEAPSFKTNLRHEFARSIIRGAGLP